MKLFQNLGKDKLVYLCFALKCSLTTAKENIPYNADNFF